MQMVHLQVSLCLGGAGGVTINLFTFVNFWEMENGGIGRVANPNTGKVPTVLPLPAKLLAQSLALSL
jgi:hypothetical protein